MASAEKGAAALDKARAKRPAVISPLDKREQLAELWRRGLPRGDSTGWPGLDKNYTIVPGQLSILTGWPSSGKSEFLDALLVNLARQGWKFVVFSPENQPIELHLSKLIEKYSGKPFGSGRNERVTQDEATEFNDAIAQSFAFIEPSDEQPSLTATEVIDAAKPQLAQWAESKRGLVIDPWNELEHWRPRDMSETEYVSATLSYVRNWARRQAVHVWIVAHPAKIARENGKLPVPRPDMISGSQHWWNKADCALTVWRDLENASAAVEIHVQKVRFKHVGSPGLVELLYDRVTGRYYTPLKAVPGREA